METKKEKTKKLFKHIIKGIAKIQKDIDVDKTTDVAYDFFVVHKKQMSQKDLRELIIRKGDTDENNTKRTPNT